MNELVKNPFSAMRLKMAEKLTPSEMAKAYLKEKTTNIVPQYWSFDNDELQTEFVKNENLVSDLEKELEKETKPEEVLVKIRKYKRLLRFVSFSNTNFINENTGEVKEVTLVNFYDEYAERMLQMGQAKIVGYFQQLEHQFRTDYEVSLEGQYFFVEYAGRTKNKKNDKKSDNFKVFFHTTE